MSENIIGDEGPSYQPFRCWSHLRRLIASLHHIEISMDSADMIIQSDNNTQSIAKDHLAIISSPTFHLL